MAKRPSGRQKLERHSVFALVAIFAMLIVTVITTSRIDVVASLDRTIGTQIGSALGDFRR
jgi:hypothetical protein